MRRTTRRASRRWPILVLAIGLLASAMLGWGLRNVAENEQRQHFEAQAAQLQLLVEKRLRQPLHGLRGVATTVATVMSAPLSASDGSRQVTDILKAYISAHEWTLDFPGVLGFGFVERIDRKDISVFFRSNRLSAQAGVALKELADRSHDDLYINTAIEPLATNIAALGLDIGSEPRRRAAVERAIDTGEPTLTAPVGMVVDNQHRTGFLLFAPVYRIGADPTTPEQRRQALLGLMVAPMVAAPMLSGLVDMNGAVQQFALFDTEDGTPLATPVFDTQASTVKPFALDGGFLRRKDDVIERSIQAPGRQLWLRIQRTDAPDKVAHAWIPLSAFVIGVMASVWLAALINQQQTVVHRTTALAAKMSEEVENLARVVRNTTDIVIITDVARKITWVNAAFEQLTGYSAAEVKGQSPGRLLQFEGTDATTVTRMREALNAGTGFRGTILNRNRAGQEYWLLIEIQTIREPDGKLTGFMAIETDITAQRQSEMALRASEAVLDKAGRIGGVGGWAYDLSTRHLQWSDQTYRMLDIEVGHPVTLPQFFAMCDSDTRQLLQNTFVRGDTPQDSWDIELPMTTASGRQIWVRIVAEDEYADGGTVRIVGAIQDITTKRAMQADVERSAQLLLGAIDAIDEAFVLYDSDDRLVHFNDKCHAAYDRSADLIKVGTTFEDIIRIGAQRGQYQEANGRIDEWVAEQMALHRQGACTVVHTLANGRMVRVVERRMPDGHIVGFHVDITDLMKATEIAEQASLAKTAFIATISHELRTPLQSVIGFSELGEQFTKEQPMFQQMFNDIHSGGMRMLTLVNDLLDFSKFSGSFEGLTLRTGDLSTVSTTVMCELSALAAQKAVTLVAPLSPLPLPAAMDTFRMQQVLRNVLANAIRFAPQGSAIYLDMINHGARGVDITVRDEGPGIPEDELERIFEPFTQSSRTRNGAGGTGLGLTICRRIMAAHDGEITAANAPAGGAIVRVHLPALMAKASPAIVTDVEEVATS